MQEGRDQRDLYCIAVYRVPYTIECKGETQPLGPNHNMTLYSRSWKKKHPHNHTNWESAHPCINLETNHFAPNRGAHPWICFPVVSRYSRVDRTCSRISGPIILTSCESISTQVHPLMGVASLHPIIAISYSLFT